MIRTRTLTWLTILLLGLSAGVFFAFSVAINPAFAHLEDTAYIAAMQHINRDIQNPIFFAAFFGVAILLPWLAVRLKKQGNHRQYVLMALSAAVYIVGVFGVTSMANVPLNDKLDKVVIANHSAAELTAIRHDYRQPWESWHAVRTVASVVSLGLAAVAVAPTTSSERKRG